VLYPQDLSFGPETRVVLVGTTVCSHDEKNLPPLPQVQQNIHDLSRLFTDPDIIGLPPEAVVPILDWGEASAVSTAIETAANEATDTLIIYYAGHGLYGDANIPLYLVSKNTISAIKSSAVRINEVKRVMSNSRATKRVLILDCCYSGRAFRQGEMASVEDDVRPAIDLIGTYGIAAVPADSKALAPPGASLTKFTQVLEDVLEHGIKKGGPVLTLGEVFDAVKANIGRYPDIPLPEAINWNEGERFRLARNRYLQRSGLDEIIKGLEGLPENVTLTEARQAEEEQRRAEAGRQAFQQPKEEQKQPSQPMLPEDRGVRLSRVSTKEHLDRRTVHETLASLGSRRLRGKEYQIRWLPLYGAAKDLKERLEHLTSIYKITSSGYQWDNYTYNNAPLPLHARDFQELYLLDRDAAPILGFFTDWPDPGERRRDYQAVQKVRERIHELNSATMSLYRMARYLGYAQRVLSELAVGQLEISRPKRDEMIVLLSDVRRELNGSSGAGIVDDLQDLIGESVWDPNNSSVITYYEFRERLLNATGWEQFTELFRFFVHFHWKMDNEVKMTIVALTSLCCALEKFVKTSSTRFLSRMFLRTRQ
jgi:hypothetical protein